MESIKYNLDKNVESRLTDRYSIDLNKFTRNKDTKHVFMSAKDLIDTSKFDNYCIKAYGEKTCILFQIDDFKRKYEMRYMDKIINNENGTVYTNKDQFYKIIPDKLQNKYTVVIVEKIIDGENDIIAVHVPHIIDE